MRSDFSRPPDFYLKEIPDELKPVAPHIGPSGYLCYLAHGTISINVFDPVGQMLACLCRAKIVLEQILHKEVNADLANEFFSFWGDDRFLSFMDVASTDASKMVCLGQFLPSKDVKAVLFLTDDIGRTAYKAAALGYDVKQYSVAVEQVKTDAAPMPDIVRWPISNVEHFLSWQRSIHGLTGRNIAKKIRDMEKTGKKNGIVIIESPVYSYAAMVVFDNELAEMFDVTPGTSFLEKPVIPLTGYRIDERYVVQRNIPGMRTLSGMNIAVIGCGTIGGFLADLLVKAGAGAGGGRLTLVDYQTIHSQNLGRHVLGFPYIGKNKAKGLAHHFAKNSPDATVRGLSADVRRVNLDGQNLIVDATADEAVSNFLIQKYGKLVPQLSVWIEGPGVAVGGHIRPTNEDACLHCLRVHVREGRYRTTAEEIPQIYAGQGCEQEYVPFPASVSLRAACLGADMVLDWIAGQVPSTLRTAVLKNGFTAGTVAASPERIEGCPACGT